MHERLSSLSCGKVNLKLYKIIQGSKLKLIRYTKKQAEFEIQLNHMWLSPETGVSRLILSLVTLKNQIYR